MILVVAALVVLALLYFIPTWIALARRSHATLGVFVVNLVLGWSAIGWLVSGLWAIFSMSEAQYRASLHPTILYVNAQTVEPPSKNK